MKKERISDAMIGAIMSEEVLAKNWDTPEEDEAWKDLWKEIILNIKERKEKKNFCKKLENFFQKYLWLL